MAPVSTRAHSATHRMTAMGSRSAWMARADSATTSHCVCRRSASAPDCDVASTDAQGTRSRVFCRNGHDHTVRSAADLLLDSVDELAAGWRELCRWDPALPPECNPPIA